MEIRIDNNNYLCEKSYGDLLSAISNQCTREEKRIIFMEILATVMENGVHHEFEKNMIERIAEKCYITTEKSDSVYSSVEQIKLAYECLSRFIFEVK